MIDSKKWLLSFDKTLARNLLEKTRKFKNMCNENILIRKVADFKLRRIISKKHKKILFKSIKYRKINK